MPREILVVDDDPAVLAVIGQMLNTDFKGPIFFALTAVKARELWQDPARDIDLMVADLSLNGESGDQLAAEFLRWRPDGRVVIVSGWNLDEAEISHTVGHKVAVVRKPFSSEELTEAAL